jgi:dimethylargininase
MTRTALVRRPSSRLSDGLVTHIERRPVDVAQALTQWQGYVDALRSCGWQTVEVPAVEDCPDGVFVEDTVVMWGDLAVISRPGADSRKPETAGTEASLVALGYRVHRITAPGTLDGGDVLKVGDRVYVGRGGRTNGDGVRQLRTVLQPLGARVTAVPVTKVLHLKSAVTALPDGCIIGYPPLVDDRSFFPHFVAVPEESGAHVVDLGESRLLLAADAPRTARLLADLGYEPFTVDIGEFQRLEGCVTCLSVRLRD